MIRLLCVLCFVSIDAFGQIAWVRDYYDKTDEKTDSASSYYFRIGKKSMNSAGVGMYIDTVSDFYTATGKKKSMEVYKEGLREGNFVHFHESGTVHARGSFIHGRLIGPVIRYYAHGGTQSTLEHSKEGDAVSPWHAIDYKIIDYWDSAGTQLVRAGNGYCKCYLYDEDGQNFLERGKVVKGLRDSVWTGRAGDGTLVFEEEYSEGEFQTGVRYTDGKARPYKKQHVMPSFPGGIPEMAKFISGNLKYPPLARRRKIQGQAFIRFVVYEDGSLHDLSIIKKVHPLLDEEALRVVALSPTWSAGEQRGKSIKTSFVLPLRFKLAN